MKAIVSVYKSDAVTYLKENKIERKEAVIMCTHAEIVADYNKKKFEEVVLLSNPLGTPNNQEVLESFLLKPKPVVSKVEVVEPPVEIPKPVVKKPVAKKKTTKKITPKDKK